MTDEIEILKRFRGASAPPTDAARESARHALASAVERESGGRAAARPRLRSRMRLWRIRAAAVAVAAIVVAALAAGLRSGSTAGPSAATAAATVLVRLADAAAAQASTVPGPGQYLYTATRSQTGGTTVLPDRSICTVNFYEYRQNWIARDGEGLIVEDDGPARYSSAQEAAECGRTGETHGTSYTWAARRCLTYEAVSLSRLPRDPAKLRALLLTGKVEGGPPGPAEALTQVADLLRLGSVPPALRAALYRAAAGLRGVLLLGAGRDELGRRGVTLAIDSGGHRTELLFAPATAELLAERQRALSAHTPAHAQVGMVLGWTAYLRPRVVDRLPQRSPLPLSPPCVHGGGTSRSVPGKPHDEVLVGVSQR